MKGVDNLKGIGATIIFSSSQIPNLDIPTAGGYQAKIIGRMDEQFYKPTWVKAVLFFALLFAGVLLTFLMYRFFPVPNQAGFDGLGALTPIVIGLGVTLILYVVGVILIKNHPYRIFALSLMLFIGILIVVRYMVIGF